MQDSLPFSPNFIAENSEKTTGLWRDHIASSRQKKLAGKPCNSRVTQAEVLIELLRAARAANRALELPQILAAGIAQHGARFNEIRARGFQIENEMMRDSSGRIHSRCYLRHDPEAL